MGVNCGTIITSKLSKMICKGDYSIKWGCRPQAVVHWYWHAVSITNLYTFDLILISVFHTGIGPQHEINARTRALGYSRAFSTYKSF